MKQIARVISTYTADVSGVCSALYELGGMVVMHDPSGCNSTYNTHDEPRWYHMDSLIFISGLAEIDAIMGNDEKLIDDVAEAAKELSPAFIALVRTPIPMLNGTDFDAIASIITRRTGIPAFYFPTNGTYSYVMGAGMALEKITDFYTEPPGSGKADGRAAERIGVNLLGVTPLDFSINSTVESLKTFLDQEGFERISCIAMGSSLSDIARAGEARVNLVVSSAGLPAARMLEKKFGIPYVAGMPTGIFARIVAEDLRQAAGTGQSVFSCTKRPSGEEAEITIIGEAVISGSLAAAIFRYCGRPVRVICPLEADRELFVAGDQSICEEEELEEFLKNVSQKAPPKTAHLIADPLYRPICPLGVSFHALPHEAFSGRIYRKQIPDLVRILLPENA